MSEESLLAEDSSTPSEESTESTETETTATPWYVSEGVAGEGDKPEFLQDKYKSLSDQAAAYPELAKKFGGFTGAPDEYEMTMPDGLDGEFDNDNPLIGQIQTWAKDNQLNQDAFTSVVHMYLNNEASLAGVDRESELAALGSDAAARLNNIRDYGKANLSEEDYQGMLQATGTAAGVKMVESLIAKTRGFQIPADNSDVPTGPTHAEIKERMSDPRYASSAEFRAETSKMYEKLFGKEPQQTTIG
jgi:hypothetical protein